MPGTFTVAGKDRLAFEGMKQLEGTELAVSNWHTVTQKEIDLFTEATGDFEWIHTDPERAAKGPFGTTIAHGFLTLSLAARFIAEVLTFDGFRNALNYGCNRVRFMSPVPVDSRIRGRVALKEATDLETSRQLLLGIIIEGEGAERPACVADMIIRFVEWS